MKRNAISFLIAAALLLGAGTFAEMSCGADIADAGDNLPSRQLARLLIAWHSGDLIACKPFFAGDNGLNPGITAAGAVQQLPGTEATRFWHGSLGSPIEVAGKTAWEGATYRSVWVIKPATPGGPRRVYVFDEHFVFKLIDGRLYVTGYSVTDVTESALQEENAQIAKLERERLGAAGQNDKLHTAFCLFQVLAKIADDRLWPVVRDLANGGLAGRKYDMRAVQNTLRLLLRYGPPPAEYKETISHILEAESPK